MTMTTSPRTHLRAALLAAATLALGAAAMPAAAGPIGLPVSGDTVSVSLTGLSHFNTATLFNLSTTLGTSQTFAGAGLEGQDITISSSVAAEAGNTVITFDISTPVDFVLSPFAGLPDFVVAYILSIGATDALDFAGAPSVLGFEGVWKSNGSTVANHATGSLAGAAFAGTSNYSTGSYGIPATLNNVNSARYTLTVAGAAEDVPEPATLSIMATGLAMVAAGRRRRSTSAARS